MKKIFLIVIMLLTATALYSQSTFKRGVVIGSSGKATLVQVDSIGTVGADAAFYTGADTNNIYVPYANRTNLEDALIDLGVITSSYPVTLGTIHYIADVADGTNISGTLNDTIAVCADKDIIVLPAGKFVITPKVVISVKDISLVGQGTDSITGTMLCRSAAATDEFIQYWDNSFTDENPVFVSNIFLRARPSQRYGSTAKADEDMGLNIKFVNMYVTDNKFQYMGSAAVYMEHPDSIAGFNGVIFDNDFLDLYRPEIGTVGYGTAINGSSGVTWLINPELGSNKFVFIEDNYFRETRHATMSGSLGKYVARYNTIEDNWKGQAIDAHGHYTNGTKGARATEAYNNTITNKYDVNGTLINGATPVANYSQNVAVIRDGDGLVYNNTADNYFHFGGIWMENAEAGAYPAGYPGNCQVGYNSGVTYGVSDFRSKAGHGDGDAFFWDNTVGTFVGGGSKYYAAVEPPIDANYVKLYRDLQVDTAKPGYVAYTYPHPNRNYYYSWLDSLQANDTVYGGELSTLTPSALSSTGVTLTWTNVLGEDGFRVYISTDNITFTENSTTAYNVVTKAITGLVADTQYWFYVVPYNDTWEGTKTETITIVTDV